MVTKEEMIVKQIEGRDITDPAVLGAMKDVDRAHFVPEDLQEKAYEDGPLPIGEGQTISQPYIVAYMAQALNLRPTDSVLEVGTGCGYNAAVLSRMVEHVYTVEVIAWLSEMARNNIKATNIDNISFRYDDGYKGWPEKAPFDAIILTAAPYEIPEPLKQQLKTGGKLLAPVGKRSQKLVMLKKTEENSFLASQLIFVNFVPMTGEAQK